MAALTNALQALGARAKQTVMRQPNAVKALHNAVRDAVEHHASELIKPGPQIDALLTAMSAVDAAALSIDDVQRPGACTYLGIVEHADYAIAAFVLAPHAKIPLHDHPNMTVLSSVISGSMRVTSFDVGADGKARRSESVLSSDDGPAALFPSVNNVHEFRAGDGGAVVLDVIVPPYDEDAGRACHYFEAVACNGGVFRLREVPEPADFECLGAVYQGLRP
ncbi:unnamed protein product [Pelagomonas calceolata]|uniref:Cysteine dioxygenase n=1 Tax=Pelagomonas calceolata TaxID=35677 RepID=A0A8J2S5A1_9STRA|nr:unnamed protein product [Pelagomonas calceolata]